MTNYSKSSSWYWEIKADLHETIQLQFDRSVGFSIEYHRRCFYDKLFIFDSDKKKKFARLCGPKPNQSWPYDALRKVGPIKTKNMEMWDVPFDTNSNHIHIAFDTDYSFQFSGFALRYWFESTHYQYAKLEEALELVTSGLLAIIR